MSVRGDGRVHAALIECRGVDRTARRLQRKTAGHTRRPRCARVAFAIEVRKRELQRRTRARRKHDVCRRNSKRSGRSGRERSSRDVRRWCIFRRRAPVDVRFAIEHIVEAQRARFRQPRPSLLRRAAVDAQRLHVRNVIARLRRIDFDARTARHADRDVREERRAQFDVANRNVRRIHAHRAPRPPRAHRSEIVVSGDAVRARCIHGRHHFLRDELLTIRRARPQIRQVASERRLISKPRERITRPDVCRTEERIEFGDGRGRTAHRFDEHAHALRHHPRVLISVAFLEAALSVQRKRRMHECAVGPARSDQTRRGVEQIRPVAGAPHELPVHCGVANRMRELRNREIIERVFQRLRCAVRHRGHGIGMDVGHIPLFQIFRKVGTLDVPALTERARRIGRAFEHRRKRGMQVEIARTVRVSACNQRIR